MEKSKVYKNSPRSGSFFILSIWAVIIGGYFFITPFCSFSQISTFTSVDAGGNWENPATWTAVGSDADGIPDADDIVIVTRSIIGTTAVTINSAAACNTLTIGDNTRNVNLNIAVGFSIAVGGNLQFDGTGGTHNFNVNNGTASVAGSVTYAGGGANKNVTVTSGIITITGGFTLSTGTWLINAGGTMTFNGLVTQTGGTISNTTTAGIVNFNAGYTRNGAGTVFTTMAGETINFGGDYTNTSPATLFNATSNVIFNGGAPTVIPTAAITFGNIQINTGINVTFAAGTINIAGNWTNLGGIFTPGTNTVIFNGTGTQTITKAGGETFYNLTSNTIGPLTLGSDVTVSNFLTMTAGNYNLASFTLTLGASGAASTLTRTTGTMYGGTFKRFIPTGLAATGVSSTGAPNVNYYGLFPVGTSAAYRPVEINSTVAPTATGYISAIHMDAFTTTDLSPTYNDAGTPIERIHGAQFVLTSASLSGGTYNIDISMTGLGSVGALSDIRLAVFTGGTTASAVGTHAAAAGTVSAPSAKRTGLSEADFNNDFRISTANMAATPLNGPYYAREGSPLVWSNPTAWSRSAPNGVSCGCIPGSSDEVIINGQTGVITMTVDGVYSIGNVTIGDGSATDNNNATLAVSGANSLTITGALALNAANKGSTYILDAGGGTINVNGTFPTWGTAGINNIQVSTGTITFAPFVNLADAAKYITYTGAGVINFNAGFTCTRDQTRFITVAGCTANITGAYTQTTTGPITWNATSNAIFKGVGSTINNAVRVNFGNVVIDNAATVSTAGAGTLNMYGDLTLNTGATFTTTKNIPGNVGVAQSINNVMLNTGSAFNLAGAGTYIQVTGNWTNNGGTLSGGTYTVRFEGIGNSIGGTSATAFPDLKFGNTVNNVAYTLNQNISCSNLIFDADNSSRTLTHIGSSSLTVTGNVTMNQPTNGPKTNLWDIGTGSATVGGDFIFAGNGNQVDRICKINISSGSFALSGNVTWMANGETATEVISLGSGTMTFANSLSMPQQSGMFNVTASGTVNFNGAAAPSYDLNQANGGAPNAVFFTSFGSVIRFNNGFRNASVSVVLADSSTAVFTGSGTITPSAPITFGNIQINATSTVTLAGNIFVRNNWTNLGGTFTPITNTVEFNGTYNQIVTKAGGESFYNLTSNATGPITLASAVLVTNLLTMTAGNYNLNAFTLTLGNNAAATLVRTAGIMYGGTFSRWFPLAAISSTVAPLYGLFPMGNSSDYRPIEINSGAGPGVPGYVSAVHTDALSVTDVTYVDNVGDNIERITNQKSTLTTSGGFAGGIYDLNVSMTMLGSAGLLSDLKMETIAGAPPGVGANGVTSGSLSSPTVKRTGLTAVELANDFVVATKNKAVTPIRQFYYSINNGDWADVISVWSLSNPLLGPAPACGCTPSVDGYAVITSGTSVSVAAPAVVDLVDVVTGGVLNGTANFTVNYDLTVYGTGLISPTTGLWSVGRHVALNGSGSSSTSTSPMIITGNFTQGAGVTFTLGAGLTVGGNFIANGLMVAGANILTLNGVAKNISGTGTITGTGSISVSNSKIILAGTSLTIAPLFAIVGAATINNNGTITLQNNLTGTVAGSTWINSPNAVFNITGDLLLTGTLNASASPNTVNYNGAGAQAVKNPSASAYYNLSCSNAGTKTAVAALTVSNMLTIQNAATFYDNTFAVTGGGGVTMSGTAIYQIGDNTNPVPSLSGAYNLTGGTINFSRAGGQNVRSIGLTGPAPAAYYNLTCSNSNTKTLVGPITVQGNIAIAGTSRLDASGSNYSVNLYGNWSVTSTNADPFNQRSGTVSLLGSVPQGISTVLAGGEAFYNLVIDNTAGVTIGSNVNVGTSSGGVATGILTLTNGVVTTAANSLILSNTSSPSLSYSSGFIYGNFRRYIASNASTYFFPVSNGVVSTDRHLLAFMNNTITGVSYLDGSVTDLVQAAPNDDATLNTTQNLTPITGTAGEVGGQTVIWTMTPDAAPTGGNYGIQLYVENTNLSGADDNMFCPLKRDDPSVTYADFLTYDGTTAIPAAGAAGRIYSAGSGYAQRTGYTAFSKFAIGKGIAPLPVELLSFNAEPNGNIVDVKWSTATEFNSDYFIVQRSKDGTVFEDVVKVEAAGNSSTVKNYYSEDYEPFPGLSYYRLKQVDNDGKISFSDIVAVKFSTEELLGVYPNPASGSFNVQLVAKSGDEVLVVLRDVTGREFYSKVVIVLNDNEVIAIDPVGHIAAGVYVVVATSNDNIYEKRVVIR